MSGIKTIFNPITGRFDLITEPNFYQPTVNGVEVSAADGNPSGLVWGTLPIQVSYTYQDQDNNAQSGTLIKVLKEDDDSLVTSQEVNGNVSDVSVTIPNISDVTSAYVEVIVSDGVYTATATSSSFTIYPIAPTVIGPGFNETPTVGEDITFRGSYLSPLSIAEGESTVIVYQYDSDSGETGKTEVFSGLATDTWTPSYIGSSLKYVEVFYTPIDTNGSEGVAVASTRVLLEPEVYSSLTDDDELISALDFRASYNTTDLITNSYTITPSDTFTHNASYVDGVGGIKLDGSKHIEIDFDGPTDTDHTVYILAKFNSVEASEKFLFGFSDGSGNTSINFGRNSTGTSYLLRYYDDGSANQAAYGTTQSLPDDARVFRLMQTSGDSDIYIDGVFKNGEPNIYSGNQVSRFIIGTSGGLNQGTFTADVEVAIVAIAPYAHSDYNRRALENYLLSLIP